MSHNISKSKFGFTLLELIVSIGILAAVSVVLIQGLYTIVSIRSKQQSIETSGAGVRTLFTTIVNSIEQAKTVTINGNIIQITDSNDPNGCRTIQYYPSPTSALFQAMPSPTCSPNGTDKFIPDNVSITSFTAVKNIADGSIAITMVGSYKDSLGSHSFNYQTTAVPRTQ